MMDEEQLKNEIKLFKENFTGQERLLRSIRSLLIGLNVSDAEKKRIKAIFKDDNLVGAVRHRIFQKETDDVPLGMINDIWMGLDAKLQGANVDAMNQAIVVRLKLHRLFNKVESYLKDPFQPKIDLRVDPDRLEHSMNLSETATDVIARNMYVKAIDMVLAIVHSLVQREEETPEQAVERIRKDSTR